MAPKRWKRAKKREKARELILEVLRCSFTHLSVILKPIVRKWLQMADSNKP